MTTNYPALGDTYNRDFWNVMRGNISNGEKLRNYTDIAAGGYAFPADAAERLQEAIREQGLFRKISTVVQAYDQSRIFAKNSDDMAEWVPEGASIPIQNATEDFTKYTVGMHKLAVFIKLDDDFVHDSAFSIEDYLVERLSKNFAKAEDKGFVTGTGSDMPFGILDKNHGAQPAVTTASISFDDIVNLYFSLDKDYRDNASWLMNDETALSLRLLKDSSGNYIWNHINGTILGKPVYISNDMPSALPGMVPVIFGDFSYYWVIDRSPVRIRTLKEAFITLDQIGYLAMEFLDGRLIRREALKSLMISSSQEG